MLNLDQNKNVICNEYPISELAAGVEEGQLMVSVLEDSHAKLQVAQGAAGEVPAGIAFGYFNRPTSAPTTENATVVLGSDSKPQVILNNVPDKDVAPVAYASTYDVVSGELKRGAILSGGQVSGNVISGLSNVNAGDTVIVTYRYTLTAQQATGLVGDITSTLPAEVTGTIGLIKRGRIYTSCFDTTCDWTAAIAPGNIKTGPNGTFTTAGNGTVIPGVSVYQLPTAESPFLGLEVSFS